MSLVQQLIHCLGQRASCRKAVPEVADVDTGVRSVVHMPGSQVRKGSAAVLRHSPINGQSDSRLGRKPWTWRGGNWALYALIVCLFFVRVARGQIVNVQPLIVDPHEEGASGVVEAALTAMTGNTELVLVSASLLGRYRSSRHLVFLLGRQEFGVQGGERFLSKDFEHLRYRLGVLDVLELETFVQHDRDEFRRLALRALWGVGPRFPISSSESVEIAVGTAYMLEFERLSRGPEPDSGQERISHRLSSYGTITLHLDDRLRVAESAYAQPRLDRPNDVRVLNESEMLVSLNETFMLKLVFSLGYDSLPAAGRRGLDTATKTSFQLRF